MANKQEIFIVPEVLNGSTKCYNWSVQELKTCKKDSTHLQGN